MLGDLLTHAEHRVVEYLLTLVGITAADGGHALRAHHHLAACHHDVGVTAFLAADTACGHAACSTGKRRHLHLAALRHVHLQDIGPHLRARCRVALAET